MNAIYLASGSPRRREILENLGFTVHRLPADIDETPKEGEAAVEYVRRMACEKNQAAVAQWFAAHDQEPEFAVLTADTTVADGEAILGKPESEGGCGRYAGTPVRADASSADGCMRLLARRAP